MQAPKKPRRSSEIVTARRGRSRTASSHSNFRSGSRFSTVTRRTSNNAQADDPLPTRPQDPQARYSGASIGSNHAFRGVHTRDGSTANDTEQPFDQRDMTDEYLSEVIMAVNVADRGSVGCCYYVARDEKLHFMEDVQLGGPDTVDALKLFIDPTVILVSTKCNTETIDRLDPELRNGDLQASIDGRTDQTRLPYLLECRPNAEFAYESARAKLASLNIGQPDGPSVTYVVPGDVVTQDDKHSHPNYGFSGRQGALLRLSGWINLESRLAVSCAGAVLAYLQRRKGTTYLPGDQEADAAFRIGTVQMFSLSGTMFINADTLLSLQITTTQSHPNAQQQGPASRHWSRGSKEGLSVYSLFHHLAKTFQGRILLRKYFLRPSLNVAVLNERHETISILLRPENSSVLDRLSNALASVKNMRAVTVNLRKGISSGVNSNKSISTSVWHSLRQYLFSTLQIHDMLQQVQTAGQLPIRNKIVETFDRRQLAEVGRRIGDVVDFEESKYAKRTMVLPGVDAYLDEARRTYNGIEDMLSEVAAHIASLVPAESEAKVNVIFFPQIGFLISIEHDGHETPATYQGPAGDPWEKMFASSTHAYYKNSNTMEMDERFGDVYGQMLDIEIEIVQSLAHDVLEYEELINNTSDICGELDALVALSQGAKQYNLVRPQMSQDNVIKITAGRHMLQELSVPTFVPNDTHIVGGRGQEEEREPLGRLQTEDPRLASRASTSSKFHTSGPSMILMTGPNYSGKSVYIKQVAIIVYMAHVGSFVPAQSATIGITDKILTRIATRESVSRIQSAFMIDLQQTSIALSLATRRSLIIIDELGNGTDSCDGAGLAAGVFEHLLQRGVECPKVLGATHFHEIFESGFLQPRPSLAFAHMQVRVGHDADEAEDQIAYLYNFRPVRSIDSYGTMCAAMSGIGRQVIERAQDLIVLSIRGEDLVEACARLPDAEMEELENAENMARNFLACDIFHEPRRLLDDLVTESGASEGSDSTVTTSCCQSSLKF